ncbi:MAG: type I-E CRISPR-associated protein Cas5/CasD [Bacillota bacterium]
MGRLLLLLRLDGPIQSWGLRSRWDVRDTGDEPSKSAVIGLLGGALGLPVGDGRLVELDRQLQMGVRVEHPGLRAIDYQTVTGMLPTAAGGTKGTDDHPSTIISPRAYLYDAAFLVGLAGPEDLLRECARALEHPKWPVYLGRKACIPTRPVLEGLTEAYADLEDALKHYRWDWAGRATLKEFPQSLTVVLESPDGEVLRPDRVQTNPARMYATRAVKLLPPVPFPGAAPELESVHVGEGD